MKAIGGAAAGVDLLVLGHYGAGLQLHRRKGGGKSARCIHMRGGCLVVQEPTGREEEGARTDAADGRALAPLAAEKTDELLIVADGLLHIGIAKSRNEDQVEPRLVIGQQGLVLAVYVGVRPVIDHGDRKERR